MSSDLSEYLLSIDFDADDPARITCEGSLTSEESAELDSYLHVGSLPYMMPPKARRLLKAEVAAG